MNSFHGWVSASPTPTMTTTTAVTTQVIGLRAMVRTVGVVSASLVGDGRVVPSPGNGRVQVPMLESHVPHPSLIAAIDWSVDWSDVATKAATVVGIVIGAFLVCPDLHAGSSDAPCTDCCCRRPASILSKLRERTPNVLLRTGDQWSLHADAAGSRR